MEIARDPENFSRTKLLITKLTGFDCAQYSDSFLRRRIEVRLRATQLATYDSYGQILELDPEERKRLLDEFTIHVTNFFRDYPLWNAVQNDVIPTIARLKRQNGSKDIRVWSAGCSTGEEPLSIMISFYEALGPRLQGFTITIFASDIDQSTVDKARAARYDEQQFKEMPEKYLANYFERDENGFYHPIASLLNHIRYRRADVLKDEKPHPLDLIFCRNTVIYFDKETKTNLYKEFFDILSSGGYLILGKTELVTGPAREQLQIFDAKERIYCKE